MENALITELESCNKIGIMGGSFDPVHWGHLAAAEFIRQEYALDLVVFVPAAVSPFKVGLTAATGTQRIHMLCLAVAENPFFRVSSLEVERPGPSYTIDTLRLLKGALPKQELFFICGTDTANELFHWKDSEEVFRLASIIAATRPGYRPAESFVLHPKTLVAEIPALEISSSEIRARVRSEKSIRYLLPDSVASYIITNKLYVRLADCESRK